VKFTKTQFKQIIKEELDAAMLDAYIENPTDMTMPEEVAFHPEMIKARLEFFRVRATQCQKEYEEQKREGEAAIAAANPIRNPELTRGSWDQIDGAEEKQKELNRITLQLNTMMKDQDFETVKQNPKFQELNARMKELMDELKNSRGSERAAGRQISDVTRNWIRTMVDQLPSPSEKCVSTFGLGHKDADKGVPYAMERWNIDYRRTDREGDYGRSRREKERRDRDEQHHQDKLRRMQRDKELADMNRQPSQGSALSRTRAGMNENKIKMTKAQLKQIIKEEVEQIQLQDLQPQVDAMVDIVGKELEQVPEDVRGIILQAVVAQLADASKDGLQERELSKSEKKEKEKIVKGMKKSKKDFKKRYGDDAESVMYATATKIAKDKK